MGDEKGKDPYEGIIVSGDSLDRELLAKTVQPFIQIFVDGDQPEIVFKTDKLTVRKKILVYLLGRKVLRDKGLLPDGEEEGLSPSQLEDGTHVKGNTLRPQLRTLLDARLVQKSDSRYFVPNYSLINVNKTLQEE